MESIKLLQFLESMLLLEDGVTQADLLLKYGIPINIVIEAKKNLDFIKGKI